MKHIKQLRKHFSNETQYYEVQQGISNAVKCKQGEHAGKWFITLAELEQSEDVEPNLEGELFLVTNLPNYVFEDLQLNIVSEFDLNVWKYEANQLHNELFASYYLPLKYEGEADIALTALNSAQYAQEALSLSKWRNDTYDLIEAVTEQQAEQMTPQQFINTLPLYVSEES